MRRRRPTTPCSPTRCRSRNCSEPGNAPAASATREVPQTEGIRHVGAWLPPCLQLLFGLDLYLPGRRVPVGRSGHFCPQPLVVLLIHASEGYLPVLEGFPKEPP